MVVSNLVRLGRHFSVFTSSKNRGLDGVAQNVVDLLLLLFAGLITFKSQSLSLTC